MQLRRDGESRMCEQMRAGPASKELKSADELETIKKENPVIMLNAGLVISTMSAFALCRGKACVFVYISALQLRLTYQYVRVRSMPGLPLPFLHTCSHMHHHLLLLLAGD